MSSLSRLYNKATGRRRDSALPVVDPNESGAADGSPDLSQPAQFGSESIAADGHGATSSAFNNNNNQYQQYQHQQQQPYQPDPSSSASVGYGGQQQQQQQQQHLHLQQQPSYSSNTNNNSIAIHSPSPSASQPPLPPSTTIRRGLTRADTKVSLRKSKKNNRRVFVNVPMPAQCLDANGLPRVQYGSNEIKTAKYSTWNFLPRNLFEQFRRVANMFFLFMAILQLTPTFTVGSPFLTVFPLCFVIGVTALKDGFEDYKRHVEDRNYNQRLCLQLKNVPNQNYATQESLDKHAANSNALTRFFKKLANGFSTAWLKLMRLLRLAPKESNEPPEMDLSDIPIMVEEPSDLNRSQTQGTFLERQATSGNPLVSSKSSAGSTRPDFAKEQWRNLRVGDVICLKNNQAVPADAIILATSEAEGSCFIETKDLDGETNLKTRTSLHETSKYTTARRVSRLKCFIDVEPPNANLFSFNATLTMLTRKRKPFGADVDGHHHQPSASNRDSIYADSITSSLVSTPRGSMEEAADYHSHDAGQLGVPGDSEAGPSSAAEYAQLHKNKRRSRLSSSMGPDGSLSTPAEESQYGEKAELEDDVEVTSQDAAAAAEAKRMRRANRKSLHRTPTSHSVGATSDMAKDVLKGNYERQLQQKTTGRPLSTISNKKQQQQEEERQLRSDQAKNYTEKAVAVDINNLLLRGHLVRNTHWVIAVIVATGTETKIMLNSGETPSKRSRIEKTMNIQVAINFLILVILCIVVAVGSSIYDKNWRQTDATALWDPILYSQGVTGAVTFFTSLIIFQNIIPISLYISIEFVKTFQAFFIWKDVDMYDPDLDQFCTPKTWNLTDDLGQIEYVFSDKTGTLTRNIMEFKKCTINGKIYGNNAVAGLTDAEKGTMMMQGDSQDPETGHGSTTTATVTGGEEESKESILKAYDTEMRKLFTPTFVDPVESLSFADPQLLADMKVQQGGIKKGSGSGTRVEKLAHDGSPSENVRDFFTLLALCHTVVIEQPEQEVADDEDDDFGVFEEGPGSPKNKDEGGRQGFRDRLKQKAEAHGLSLPSSAPGPAGGRSRKNSNAGELKKTETEASGVGSVSNGGNGSAAASVSLGDKVSLAYRAESPDEAALVSAAKNVGFAFVSRGAGTAAAGTGTAAVPGGNSRQNINVNILGNDHTYEQLDVIKFNSTRKRMTVIVREPTELGGRILLLSKGADNVIFERLTKEPSSETEAKNREQTEIDIETFSNMGLRTLTLAQRVLDQKTYDSWATKYAEANKSLEDRAKKVDQVAEEIECEMTLLGATAIEDKLQEGVPDAIAALRQGGIKVWVLTGDKLETAINIGFASRLLEKSMQLEIMKMGKDEPPAKVLQRFKVLVEGVMKGIRHGDSLAEEASVAAAGGGSSQKPSPQLPVSDESYRTMTSMDKQLPKTPLHSNEVLTNNNDNNDNNGPDEAPLQHALIVDGSALKVLLDDPDARADLIRLSDECYSVICCRTSPLQKALVVELIRRGKNTICLAIGDGANDVSMIQAANIGVGIAGQEGMQAAMASDYSITQFRFVQKLVLVHGHWGYMRIAEMILNFFFKNIIWVACVLWFQIYCGFSANIFYDYTFVSLYNLCFTAVPVLVLGATDQDAMAAYVLRFPGIYKIGIRQAKYSQVRFVLYMLDGVWQSLIVFWTWRAILTTNVIGRSGGDSSQLELSTAVAITNIVIVSLYLGMHTYHWTWLMHFAVWGSIVFLVLVVLGYGAISASPIYHVGLQLIQDGSFWFGLLFATITALLLKYTVRYVASWYFPDDVDIIQGIQANERQEAKKKKVPWTGLGDEGTDPNIMSKQERAFIIKENREYEEKQAEKERLKAEKQASGHGGFFSGMRHRKKKSQDRHPLNRETPALMVNGDENYGSAVLDMEPLEHTTIRRAYSDDRPPTPPTKNLSYPSFNNKVNGNGNGHQQYYAPSPALPPLPPPSPQQQQQSAQPYLTAADIPARTSSLNRLPQELQ